MGNLIFNAAGVDSDVGGLNFRWFRPAVTERGNVFATKIYTEGWPSGIVLDAVGALYNASLNVRHSLGLPGMSWPSGNAKFTFRDGGLVTDLTSPALNILDNNKVELTDSELQSERYYSMKANQKAGIIQGYFPVWDGSVLMRPVYRGIVLQKGANKGAFGYFIIKVPGDNDPESGRMMLRPL